jgi:hypothetical protein
METTFVASYKPIEVIQLLEAPLGDNELITDLQLLLHAIVPKVRYIMKLSSFTGTESTSPSSVILR